nr:sterile alpha motif domain-containing protein 3-like isoform X4 [Misgurnus anguillicaudatus]
MYFYLFKLTFMLYNSSLNCYYFSIDCKKMSTEVIQWTTQDVADWLTANSFHEFIPTFQENEIDGDTLINLTENMIAKIFPKMKDQVKFIRLQKQIKTEMPTKTTYTSHETSSSCPVGAISTHYIARTGWPTNYQLPNFPMSIQKRLDEESGDFFSSTGRSKWRSKIIQALFDQMCAYTWYPTSDQYNKVCLSLVTKYQFLRDKTGRGYESWHEMLKNKFKKERLPLVEVNEIKEVRCRFSKVRNHKFSSGVQQIPSAERPLSEGSESGEDDYSIGVHLEKMKTECLKKTPNIKLLVDYMARTRNERTDFIKHNPTKDTLTRYPALKVPLVLAFEVQSILDTDIERNILKNLGLVAQKVINECHRRQVGVDICTELDKAKQAYVDLAHRGLSMAAAALLLPFLFKESPRFLYVINEVPNTPNPVLYIKGSPLGADSILEIMMEGEKVCEVDDVTIALVVLMAVHFIFNIEYAPKIRNTLTFIEKYLMCHNDTTKMPPAVIKMANFLFK